MNIAHPKRWAYLIGTGVALFPIHNLWLTHLLTTKDGVTQLFLPALGTALWAMGAMLFCVDNITAVQQFTRSLDKKVLIPLLTIAGAISLSGLGQHGNRKFLDDLETNLAPFLTAVALLSIFVSAKLLGKQIFYPLAIGSALASLGVVAHALVFRGEVTGGYVFGYNYDIVVGYILLGTVLYMGRGRLWLASLSLVALFLTGSPEGVFSTVVLGVFLIARELVVYRYIYIQPKTTHNIRTFVLLIAPTLVVAGLWFSLNYGQELYRYTWQVATDTSADPAITTVVVPAVTNPSVASSQSISRKALSYRFEVIKTAMSRVEPLGSGLVLTEFKEGIVHNVPLILVQQLGYPGILGAAAWIWLCVWGLWKSKWKYGWLAMISLGVFDHFVWTQLSPLMWMLAGVSAGAWIKDDLILKKVQEQDDA